MLNTVLNKLTGVTKNGRGHMALCPSHPDKKPSLAITESANGRVLLHCLAGCDTNNILRAIHLEMKDLFPEPVSTRPTIAATYDYVDEGGQMLFQVVRCSDKRFFQRRPANGGWVNNLNDTRRVLYRLPELLHSDKNVPVFIAEGEKDVEALRHLGAVATCNPHGAGKWKSDYGIFLKGRICVILPDNDVPGEQHAESVATSLLADAAQVSILRLPGLPDKGDVSDWIDKGNSLEDLHALLTGAEVVTFVEKTEGKSKMPMPVADQGPKGANKRSGRQPDSGSAKTSSQSRGETQSSRLVKLADDVELFHTTDKEAFATVSVNSHKETFALKSRDFRDWLMLRHWNAEKVMPSSQAVQDAIYGLSGKARFEGETKSVHLRVAEMDGSLYLDLGNENWDIVKMTSDGWELTKEPPVKFRRTKGTLPLPKPERAGRIDDLKRFANVSDEDWPLALAWLAAAFRPNRPFPVLVLHGEQGSGKSTTAKVLRLLIDPNKSPLRSSPKDERDLMIAANNSWIISLDNLSSMSVALSDSLCRLSTGGGYATRELFSDGEEVLLNLTRPVILNGIDEVINRSDLLDRSILLHLPRLKSRFDESTFWTEFENARPQLLGALLDAVCIALSEIDNATAHARNGNLELPRLGDFTLWGVAAETGLGLERGQFFERYKANREGVHDLALDCDPFAEKVLEFMNYRGGWTGSPSELFEEILKITSPNVANSRGFPKNPQGIGRRLSLLAPNLREHGTEYIPPDRNKRDRSLTLRRAKVAEDDKN